MKSFISVLISEHIIHLIFLLLTYNMTYLKFLFLDSLLSGSLGGSPLAKAGSTSIQGISARLSRGIHQPKLGVLVFKASLLNLQGGPSAKVCLSDKYELLLNNFQCNCLQEIHSCFGGFISQSRFVCQIWCTDIQGISAL